MVAQSSEDIDPSNNFFNYKMDYNIQISILTNTEMNKQLGEWPGH